MRCARKASTWPPARGWRGTSFKLERPGRRPTALRIGDAHEALSRRARADRPRAHVRAGAAAAVGLRADACATSASPPACSTWSAMTPVLHVSQRYPGLAPLRRAGAAAGAASAHRLARDRVRPRRGSRRAARRSTPTTSPTACTRRPPTCPRASGASPLKEVHTNKCPALVRWDHLREADFDAAGHRPGRSAGARRARCAPPGRRSPRRCAACSPRERRRERVRRRCRALRRLHRATATSDCSRGAQHARRHLLATSPYAFRDPRLPELLFRYRARNWPESLTAGERALERVPPPPPGQRQRPVRIRLRQLPRAASRNCAPQHPAGPAQALLDALEDWGRQIEARPETTALSALTMAYFSRQDLQVPARRWRATTAASGSRRTRPTTRRTCAQPFQRLLSDLQPDLAAISTQLPRRSAAGGRLAVPHPPRHALRQRQDAVQDPRRRAPVPPARAARWIRPRSTCTCSPATASSAPACGIRKPDTLRRIRQFIVDNPGAWQAAVHSPAFRRRFEFGTTRCWSAAPPAFPPDFRFIDDLKRKNFVADARH